jgi:aryl-alcohol dehydrogenase-like predicted oxidoreductase
VNVQYRTFGRAGWQVSEIAFGGWQLGGGWGAVDDTESVKTLHHAYERGINFADTAELYGGGHSEEVIGEPLRQPTQDRPSIKTGGPVFADGRDSSTRGSS